VRVQVGDVRLFFDVEGAGLVPDGPWMRPRPTILLLHPGPGFDHALYKVLLGPRLAPLGQVVYLDQRGNGRSDTSPRELLTLETWADDVRAFCDALAIERPVVLGHGFGALVAAAYAARHPEHPRRLVLVNGGTRVVPGRSVAVYERLGGAAAGEAAKMFYDQPNERTFAVFMRHAYPHTTSYGTAEVATRATWNPDVLIHWRRYAPGGFDLRGQLGSVRAPTLLLAGEDDPELTPAGSTELLQALPEGVARLRTYPKARHGVFRDAPGALEELLAFLAEPDQEAGAG
jgi:pimeloyl-ACP methyl ester carboxylesterase